LSRGSAIRVMVPPPAKKQKTEEEEKDAAMTSEDAAPAKAEPPKELETDAPKCAKPKVKGAVGFLVQDTTLNVMMSESSNTLMSLREGGLQHLLAGARASVGISKGRYMFEVKIIEFATVGDSHQRNAHQHVLKVGFATEGSSLFLGATDESVCFESNGDYVHNKTRSKACFPFGNSQGTVIGVVLNLDPSSPNSNTISLFKDGVRLSQPQALPESLRGKALFPAITYKNVTTHVNFGTDILSPLPFKCRMLQDAAASDVVVTKPADGKCEVVFPVGLPDEGTFDRLDQFLEKNPKFTEISDRMILDWAEKSGVARQRGYGPNSRSSFDKPEKGFGIKEMDDDSVRRAILTIAPMQARSYVVMEVKGNLMEDERKALLSRWKDPMFKKIADVVVGEPTAEYKRRVQDMVLRDKQAKAEKAWEARKVEKARQKQIAQKKKEAEKARQKMLKLAKKKAEEAKKKAEEAAKKKAEDAKKKAEGENEGEAAEKKDEEMKEEGAKEEGAAKEEEKEEDEEEDEAQEEPEEPEEPMPKETLTPEEKKLCFRPSLVKDLAAVVLSTNFTKFTLPKKEEGFDEIRYEWAAGPKAEQYLKQWILDKKVNSRVEELKPSNWSREKLQSWQKVVAIWQKKQQDYKAASSKKMAERASRKAMREREAVKAAAVAAAKAKLEEKKEQDGQPDEKQAEAAAKQAEAAAKQAEAAEAARKKAEEEVEKENAEIEAEEEAEASFKTLDIFGAEDVLDVGGGLPLCKEFQPEDWTLMGLLFELNLLIHAFVHDVNDPERPGIHLNHLAFYYKKYFSKELRPKDFGVESLQQVVELVGDKILYLDEKEVLGTQLDGEFESYNVFPKLIELARRDRRLRADLGEESAILKLSAKTGKGGSYGPVRDGRGDSGKGAGRFVSQGLVQTGAKGGAKGAGFPGLAPRFRPYGGSGKGGGKFPRW